MTPLRRICAWAVAITYADIVHGQKLWVFFVLGIPTYLLYVEILGRERNNDR